MQTECRTTSLLDCYAEVQLILCKDIANKVIRQPEHFQIHEFGTESPVLQPLPICFLHISDMHNKISHRNIPSQKGHPEQTECPSFISEKLFST